MTKPLKPSQRTHQRLSDAEYRTSMLDAIRAIQARGESPTLERIATAMHLKVNTRRMPSIREDLIESGLVSIDEVDPDDESHYSAIEIEKLTDKMRDHKRLEGEFRVHRTGQVAEMPWRIYRHPTRR